MNERSLEFTSKQTRNEVLTALTYLPVHLFVMPVVLVWLSTKIALNEANINFLAYAIGAVYMIITQRRFLRREFDALCDRLGNTLLQVCICYGLMLCCNFVMNLVISFILPQENPNNAAIMDMASYEYNNIFAVAVFLAPIIEELIFRAGIFGALRGRNRVVAYAVSMLAFSAYHVWSYALINPVFLLYIIQYLPVSYLLCRCYEKSNTIWASVLLHAVINFISLRALTMLQELL